MASELVAGRLCRHGSGGYTGKFSGGPPGNVTITSGLKEVAVVVRAMPWKRLVTRGE